MLRGTTPTHVFTLPFDTETVKDVQIIYVQGGKEKLTKSKDDCTLDGNEIAVKLTQEETFSFDDGKCVKVQVRVLTQSDDVLISPVMLVECEECLFCEVLQ